VITAAAVVLLALTLIIWGKLGRGRLASALIPGHVSERMRRRSDRCYIIENISDAIIVVDGQRRIIDLNQATLNLLDSKSSDISGLRLDEIGLAWMRDLDLDLEDLSSTKEIRYGEDENERFYQVEFISIGDDKLSPYRAIVIHDITEPKRAKAYWEAQFRRYSTYLERIVEERTGELRDAERMAAIGELAAMVGHDIRNPLTAISGASYYLRERSQLGSDERSREMLDLIDRNVDDSNKIISDLLEYSREIKLDRSRIALRDLVEDAISSTEFPENARVVCEVDDGEIEVDILQMKRVFVNILKNAVDAMPDGGTLTVSGWADFQRAELYFADTGVGIPEAIIDDIWKPLFTTKAKGMGFGLAICKRIVEAHGGTVSVESVEGLGTTFTIVLPGKSELPDELDALRADEILSLYENM